MVSKHAPHAMRPSISASAREYAVTNPWVKVLGTFVLAGVMVSCGTRSVEMPQIGEFEADRLLFERGRVAIDEGDWSVAREYFTQIRDNYPQSDYRAEARLQIGDTYEGEGTQASYVRALEAYQDFMSLYPTHPRVAYAQYKLGMIHLHQMNSAERDQTDTLNAVAELETFIARFPAEHELTPQVREALRSAHDRLSEHDYLVGYFYYRFRNYAGAISRFRQILENDPGYTRRDRVYFQLAVSLAETQQTAEAIPYLARVLDEFNDGEFAEDARRLLDELASTQDR